MIELYITGAYRHFSVKNNLIHSPENIPLEKALNSVITQNYSLSI